MPGDAEQLLEAVRGVQSGLVIGDYLLTSRRHSFPSFVCRRFSVFVFPARRRFFPRVCGFPLPARARRASDAQHTAERDAAKEGAAAILVTAFTSLTRIRVIEVIIIIIAGGALRCAAHWGTVGQNLRRRLFRISICI